MSTAIGHFEGEVVARWLTEPDTDDRTMELVEDFAFVDTSGKRWEAKAGRRVDGASIPWGVWTVVGSPYVGNYRRASVIHDVYCEDLTEPSEDVHRMFHQAMLADGTSPRKAWTMYRAVVAYGPSWTPKLRTSFVATRTLPALDASRLENAVDQALDELGADAPFEAIDRRITELMANQRG